MAKTQLEGGYVLYEDGTVHDAQGAFVGYEAPDGEIFPSQADVAAHVAELEAAKNPKPVFQSIEPDSLEVIASIGRRATDALKSAGFDTIEKIAAASDDDLTEINGIAETTVAKIRGLIAPKDNEKGASQD